ncbi:MAG: 2-oxoglutarate and iron-dependent oxygenase domain-containing protein [Chloroflexota bacterium]
MKALPTIDISALFNGSEKERKKAADQMGEAAREIGFFRVKNHQISQNTIENAYTMAQAFFAMSEEIKDAYYIGNSSNHRGYVPFTEKGDYADEVSRNYEAFDLALDLPKDDPDFLNGNLLLGPNVWPSLIGFKETIYSYYQSVATVGQMICSALELHLDLPDGTITQHMTKPISQLRLIHYVRPNEQTKSDSVNMGAHTDYECLTMLHQKHEGFQVLTLGDEWIDVPVDPETYIVNIGDMLEAWTNGILRSTPHRVLNLSPERFSMPYFVAANYDTVIQPLDQFVSADSPVKYEPFYAGQHLERMLRRDFPYLRHRQNPELALNSSSLVENPFENRIAP